MSDSDTTVPAHAKAESPFLLHVWVVDPSQEGVAMEHLDAMLREASKDAAFVRARVLESADGHSIAVILEMRTVEDRQRLEALPAVRETLDNLAGTVNLVVKLFREVATYS